MKQIFYYYLSNAQNLKVTRVLLLRNGCEVQTAVDAEHALNVLRSFEPRLILMDIQLPGMDGLELTRRLKADPETRPITIVALTPYANERGRQARPRGRLQRVREQAYRHPHAAQADSGTHRAQCVALAELSRRAPSPDASGGASAVPAGATWVAAVPRAAPRGGHRETQVVDDHGVCHSVLPHVHASMRLLWTSVGRARALRRAMSIMPRTFSNPDAVAGRPVSDQPSSTTPPEKRGFTRTLLMAVALSVVMAGAGYLAGRLRAWSALRETETQLQVAVEEHERAFEKAQADHLTALSEAEAKAEKARAQRARLVELTTLYEGYRTAQMALLALDARNFGIAESHLREAERILAPLASEVERLPEMLARVADTDIEVASNLEAQRQSVLSLVGELDALIAAERVKRGVENVGTTSAAAAVTDAAVATDGKATTRVVP